MKSKNFPSNPKDVSSIPGIEETTTYIAVTPVKKPEEDKYCIEVKVTEKQQDTNHHPVIPREQNFFSPPPGQEFELELSTGENIQAMMSTSPSMHGHMHSKPQGTIQAWWRQAQPKMGNTLKFEEIVPKKRHKMTILSN